MSSAWLFPCACVCVHWIICIFTIWCYCCFLKSFSFAGKRYNGKKCHITFKTWIHTRTHAHMHESKVRKCAVYVRHFFSFFVCFVFIAISLLSFSWEYTWTHTKTETNALSSICYFNPSGFSIKCHKMLCTSFGCFLFAQYGISN